MTYKPVDAAITMVVGPCIDDTDFKSLEEAIAYNAAGMDVSLIVEKTDGTTAVTAITLTTGGTSDWTHKDGGYYEIEVTAAQNAEEGVGYIRGVCTGVLPFESAHYNIVKANVYDSWVKGTDVLHADITQLAGATQSLTDLKDFADAGYDPGTNKVQGVVLCDTTTTNTDMKGTDGANTTTPPTVTAIRQEMDTNSTKMAPSQTLNDYKATGFNTVVPDVAGTAATPAEVATSLSNIHLDHLFAADYDPASKPGIATALLNELVESDSGVSRYTANALEQAPSAGTNPNVLINTTIASVSDQTHFVLTAGSNDDDAYKDQAIVIYDASDSDFPSIRVCNAYTGATKTVTLDSTPDFTIVAGDGCRAFVTAPGTTAPTVGQIRTEMEGAGYKLAIIEADTNELQTNQGAWATATGFSTHSAADVKTAIEQAGSSIATILTDTGELQTDWVNGGRLDNLLDAIPTTAMRGTDGANTTVPDAAGVAPTAAEIQTQMEGAGSKILAIEGDTNELQTDWKNTGRLDNLLDACYTGTPPTVTQIRQEMDANSAKMAPSQVLADYKATGFSTHDAAAVKTAIEAAGSTLATILVDTNDLQTNQGAWATATGFSTHNAAAVWSVATRILTASTNFNDLTAAEMKAEVVAALADIKLDHLINIAVDTDWATTVHLDSVIGHMADVGTAATFNRTTDALEALRNRGDAAWIAATGFSTHSAADVKTAIEQAGSSIATILTDTGELQTDWVNGGRLDNLLDAIPTTAMRGTDGANTTVPDVAGTLASYDPPTRTEATTDKDAIIADLLTMKKTAAGAYDRDTDSLEAIRDRGDAAWSAAAGTPSVLIDTTINTVTDQTHFTLVAGSGVDDAYKDQAIVMYDVTNSDYPSIRKCTAYTGGTKTITLDSAPDFTIAGSDKVKVFVTAPGTTAPSAATVADAVWDEVLTGATHNIATSAGRRLREISAFAIHGGTAQAGATISITLAAGASADDGVYNRNLLVITEGTGAGQTRQVADYNGTSKVVTVDREWRVSPDATSVYQITADNVFALVDQGNAQAGTATTITLRAYASSVDDTYLCNQVAIIAGTGRGQARLVGAYNGTTKVATICGDNWVTTPDASSVYVLMPYGTTCTSCIGTYALSQINSEADDALTDYGANTVTPDAAGVAPTADEIKTEVEQAGSSLALILADTNELQTDWVNGGRLDLLIDLILGDTAELQGNQGDWATATSVTVSDKTGFALSGAGVDAILDENIEGTHSMREMMRLFASMLVGKVTGGGTTAITFRDIDDSKNRIVMTVTDVGNRTGVVLTED